MTKILIVEDEAGLRQGLEINLRHENYETVTAADGDEAIRLFHAESPDLVLLDLMLPKKSGFEVLDHIRKLSKVPVILLTARGQETDKVRGLRSGADDYVTKPFGVQELFARIDVCVRQTTENVIIEVRDRGIGIDTRDLARIFDPYYRAKFSDTQTRRGAGLGLTLVQQIAASHGGRVEVDSEPGQGSTFRLLFPRSVSSEAERVPVSLQSKPLPS